MEPKEIGDLKEVKSDKQIPNQSDRDIENELEQEVIQLNDEPAKLQLEEHGLDDQEKE